MPNYRIPANTRAYEWDKAANDLVNSLGPDHGYSNQYRNLRSWLGITWVRDAVELTVRCIDNRLRDSSSA